MTTFVDMDGTLEKLPTNTPTDGRAREVRREVVQHKRGPTSTLWLAHVR